MLNIPRYHTDRLTPATIDSHRLIPEGMDDFPVPAPEPLIDRFDLLYLVKKHLLLLLAIPAACAAAALLFSSFKQPLFESSALVYIDPKFDEILRFEKSEGGSPSDLDSLSSLEIMIMGNSMVLRVVDKLDLRTQPGCLPDDLANDPNVPDQKIVRFFQENRFSAQLSLGTRLLKISVLDPDPERSRLIAETFVSEFDRFLIQQRQAEAKDAREILENQVVEAKNAALEAEDSLREFRQSHPKFPVEQDHDMFATRLTQFSTDLNSVVSQRMEMESKLELLNKLDPSTSPSVIVEVTGYQTSQHVANLLNLHTSASAKLAASRQQLVPSDPRLLAAVSEFEKHDSQLQEMAAEIKSAIRSKYEATKNREANLRTQLETIQTELVEMKSLSSEFRAVKQEAERRWLVHDTLQNRLSESVLAIDSSSNIATEVSQPMRPYKKASPNYLIALIVGGGLGTLLSASWIGTKIFSGLPLNDKSQLERYGLPVVADWTSAGSLPAPGEAAVFLHSLGAHRAKIVHITAPDLPDTAALVATSAAKMAAAEQSKSLLVTVRRPRPESGPQTGPQFSESDYLSSLTVTPQAAMQGDALENYLLQFGSLFQHIFLTSSGHLDDEITRWLASLADQNIVIAAKGSTSKRKLDSCIAHLTSPGMAPLGLIVVDPDNQPLEQLAPAAKQLPFLPGIPQFA